MPNRFLVRACGFAAAVFAPLAASAGVQVWIGSSWQVFSGTNIDQSANGLLSETLVQGPSYGGIFAIDPVSLADSYASTSTGEAQIHDPLNQVGLPLVFSSAGSASATYTAVVGNLGLELNADATVLPDHVLVQPPSEPNPPAPVTVDNPLNANGIARIHISYEDQIRFCASGLALGAPIEVHARMQHPAAIASSNTNFNNIDKASSIMTATLGGAQHWDGSYQYGIQGGGTFVLTDRSENGVVITDDPDEVATTLALFNGDLLDVAQDVDGSVGTAADAPFPATASWVTVAGAQILLEPVTAGVTVTRLGGGAPCTVPEAGSGGLALAAIATLHACGALRRRSSQ